jgi:hypothetical protein
MPKPARVFVVLVVLIPLVLAACGTAAHVTKKLTGPSPTSHAAGIKFASCIRAHGVPDFPDPLAGSGGFSFPDSSPGLFSSPAFRKAQESCKTLMPHVPPGHMSQASINSLVLYAQCMRKRGVRNYPDPTIKNDREAVVPLSTYGIDTNSPAFIDAAKACNNS